MEKSEHDFPAEKAEIHDSVDVQETSEDEEFVHEEQQFTFRAAIVGSILGVVVAASNLYLGLKIGWSFGAALWGSIFGFLALKAMSKVTGSVFGPKENAVCQTAATSAGGLSAGFVTAVPAMYRLGLMGVGKDGIQRYPQEDIGALFLWTTSAAFFGMFFAVPLRSHFVINQDLVFPTPRAAAETIKSLHRAGSAAAKDASDAGKAMAASFMFGMIWYVLSFFIPGFFGSIHLLYFIGNAMGNPKIAGADATWGWTLTWDWAFIGAGLMTPGNTVASFLIGEIIAFGIAGPIMVSNGFLLRPTGFPPAGQHSAVSFFLWPGIAMMVVTAFCELGVQGKSLAHAVKEMIRGASNLVRKASGKPLKESSSTFVSKDTCPPHELIPMSWWVGGLTVSGIFTILVMFFSFQVPVYATIGAILLSFFTSFVALQASGETDINPTGPVAKVTQLVFSRIPGETIQIVQKTNLMCANITASICSQSVDMVGDLKTAQLLNASPRAMFWAQLVGSVFAIAAAIPLFLVYTKAYPCIVINKAEKCQFATPAVNAWQNVCMLLTGTGSVSKESMYLSIAMAILAVVNVVVRQKLVPKAWHPYWLNLNALGLGFINPSGPIPVCMAIGWTAGQIWIRVNKRSHERLMYSISAGLIAGVGIAGLINAAMTIGGVEEGSIKFLCGTGEDAVC